MKAFTIMGRTLKAAYDELFLCVFLSIIWWIGTILILPAAPVTIGLHQVANRIANYKRVDNSFFWESARQHIGRGWLLYLINLLAPVAIFFNIWFYFNSQGLLQAIGVFWMWLFVLSLMIGQYIFPLFWQQDEPDLKLVLRNATLLALRHPLYTFLILLFQLTLLVLSIGLTLPLILLAPALIALTANFALVGLLQEMGLAPHPPQAPPR
jgi:uncharacterized membrane protein YesL